MPSGKTHDRLTLWLIPWVLLGSLLGTRSERLTLILTVAFGFSGLMFGPDLDIYSVQYRRWGWLRWLWLPYRHCLRHRSILSHGFLIGTCLRIVYLSSWLLLVFGLGIGLILLVNPWLNLGNGITSLLATDFMMHGKILGEEYLTEGIALLIGLEMGAMSHSLADWLTSSVKQFNRRSKQTPPKRKRHSPKS